jgi:NLR family CARD domain-containing protein 3
MQPISSITVFQKRFPGPASLEIRCPFALGDQQTLMDALTSNRWIRSISFRSTVHDVGPFASSLAQLLSKDLSIQSLSISTVSHVDAIVSVMKALDGNANLTSLSFPNIDLRPLVALKSNVQDSCFHALRFLHQLNLSGSSLRDEGAEAVAQILQRPDVNLRDLNLGVNVIGDSGASSIAKALRSNTTLRRLNLWSNRIHDAGASALGKMLQKNTTLTFLDISSGYIIKDGLFEIAAALSSPACSLHHISFWSNDLVDSGVEILASSLQLNTSLVSLNLAANKFGESGCAYLAQALKTNQTLRSLDVSMNKLKTPSVDLLIQAIAVNESLTYVNVHDGSGSTELEERTNQALQETTSRIKPVHAVLVGNT